LPVGGRQARYARRPSRSSACGTRAPVPGFA